MSAITWRRVFRVIPVPILYARRLVSKGFAGTSYGVLIAIHPDYRDDAPLLEHELEHCRQFYRSLGLNALLYALSRRHRYRLELEAYRVQLLHQEPHARWYYAQYYARHLAHRYGLDRAEPDVLADLLDGLPTI